MGFIVNCLEEFLVYSVKSKFFIPVLPATCDKILNLLLHKLLFDKNSIITSSSLIKSFKDIKLRDFKYDEKCKDGQYKQEKKGRNITFKEYAIRLRLMLNNIITRQNNLIKILNKVFYINKKSNPVTVSIHYDLNELKLDKLIKETRVLIKKLYIECEKDFLHVLEIYFVLINKVEYKTEIRQESNLKELSNLNASTFSIYNLDQKTS